MYETLLAVAVLWGAALPFGMAEDLLGIPHLRGVFQAYLGLVAGVYFVWQWVHGGQTLPMKTWGLRLVGDDGGSVPPRQATLRYFAALAGAFALGAGFLWALVDRDRKFLHDRLARTRIVRLAPGA